MTITPGHVVKSHSHSHHSTPHITPSPSLYRHATLLVAISKHVITSPTSISTYAVPYVASLQPLLAPPQAQSAPPACCAANCPPPPQGSEATLSIRASSHSSQRGCVMRTPPAPPTPPKSPRLTPLPWWRRMRAAKASAVPSTRRNAAGCPNQTVSR